MSKIVLYVAVVAATGAQRFFRCGMEFTPAWKKVEVDEATAQRLREEQMLRVVDEQPGDYEDPAAEADEAGSESGSADATSAPGKAAPSASGAKKPR